MNRRKALPIFSLIILLSLCIGGVAYAHWSEYLMFDGIVTTGEFDAEFSLWGEGQYQCGLDEYGDWIVETWSGTWENPTFMGEPDCKDIGKVFGTVSADGKTLTIDITNAYPGYVVLYDFEIQNTGTVPWRLWFVKSLETGEIWHDYGGWIPLPSDDADGCVEAYMSFDDQWFGVQVDPNDPENPDISMKIYFTNCIEEGESLSISLELYYLNWNEWFQPDGSYGTWVGNFIPRGSLDPPLPAI